MRFVLILIVALIVAAGAYYFFTQQEGQDLAQQAGEVAEQAADAAKEGADQMANLVVDGVDLGKEVTESLSDLKTSLEGVTDAASAEAVKPQLEKLKGKIGEWGQAAEKLPAEGQSALASAIAAALPALEEAAAKLESIEGVGPVIKPTLDDLLASLKQWSEAKG